MAAISSLLQSLQPNTPPLFEKKENGRYWCFKSEILNHLKSGEMGIRFFRPFIDQYEHLIIFHQLSCSLIAKTIHSHKNINANDKILEELLKNALAISNLLHVINANYFDEPQACFRLSGDEKILSSLLGKFDYHFSSKCDFYKAYDAGNGFNAYEKSFSKWLREQTVAVNWPRLLIVRSKRVLDTMVPIFKGLPNFVEAVKYLDQATNPIFAYLSWSFYFPRLTLNLFLFLKNVVPHPWMSKQQQQLGYAVRLKSQLKDKWFELCNDSIWLTVGLVNCFVLIGSLAPCAMYLTISLYAVDVALACIKAYRELNKLQELRKKLINSSQPNISFYLSELDKHLRYESQRLGLGLVTTIGLFIGMLFAVPFLASNPVLPLFGAIYIVALSVSTFIAGKNIKKKQPSRPLPTLIAKQIEHLFEPKKLKPSKARYRFHSVLAEKDRTACILCRNIRIENNKIKRDALLL